MSEGFEKLVEKISYEVENTSSNYVTYRLNGNQDEVINSLRNKGYTVWGPSPGNHIAVLNKNRKKN